MAETYYFCDNTHRHPNKEVLQIKTLQDDPKCPYCGGVMTYGRYWGPLIATRKKTEFVTILDPGKTIFLKGEAVPRETFDQENERVKKLGERQATGETFTGEVPLGTNHNPTQVRFWNGVFQKVKDREEAVEVIKKGLDGWMQKGDRIIWYNTPKDDELGRKPSYAVVVNEVGEETDASAMILYKD